MKKVHTTNIEEINKDEPFITIPKNEENNISYANTDIERVIAVFGEDNIRDIIKKITNSDKVLSFTYIIDDRGELYIKQALLHSIYTASIKDLILSAMIWNDMKNIWDSDNDTYMYPYIVSIEDVSGNDAIIYDGEKIYFKGCSTPLRIYELYDLVYLSYNDCANENNIEKWKRRLELDKVRAYHPYLKGFAYFLTSDEVKEISTIYKELGISLIAMGDYSSVPSNMQLQYIIVLDK